MHTDFHKKLKQGGFFFKKNSSEYKIPEKLIKHYPNLPTEYLNFLKSFKTITNSSDTTWFNSIYDFSGSTDTEFKWNEFEILSLEWSENDDEELLNVTEFWKKHIPIILSVKNGFHFLAINLTKENYGEIVHGQEPVFEDVTKVCNNFTELIDLLENKKIQQII